MESGCEPTEHHIYSSINPQRDLDSHSKIPVQSDSCVNTTIMSSKYDNVIVFGPTGAVGRAAVAEASKRGAKVWLAMRDTAKSINKELDGDQFSRLQADLTDPESVKKAIQTSGANAAFFYLAFHAQDSMKHVLQAMKDAGITYLVFLSSFTIPEDHDVRDVPPEKVIPYIHAQVEANLEDLKIPHTTLRPGNFASNGINHALDKKKTPYEAIVPNGDRLSDCIVQSDIGRVGGAVLVDRPSTAFKEIIYLYGPELLKHDETWEITKIVTGKDIKVTHPSVEEIVQFHISIGTPEFLARYLVKTDLSAEAETENRYPRKHYETGSGNVRKYSGYEPTTFKEWIATQEI